MDLNAVEKLLKANKALVYSQCDITDLSDRTFPKITAFQYATWALDKPMWELILKYLPEDQAGLQLKALEDDREDITKKHGAHFSFDQIIERLRYHHGNYRRNYDRLNNDQFEAYWCKKVGGAQRAFPAWLIMMMCEERPQPGVVPAVAWTKQKPTLSVKRDVKHLLWWMSKEVNKGVLGSTWAAARGSGSKAVPWGYNGHLNPLMGIGGCVMLVKISSERSQELLKLKRRLFPNDTSLTSIKKGRGY